MKPTSVSLRIFFALVILLAGLAALNVYLPQGDFVAQIPAEKMPASSPLLALVDALVVLIVYGGLGYIGLILSARIRFTPLWNGDIEPKQRLGIPFIVGIVLGIGFILVDALLSHFHNLGPLVHPPFPTSVVASFSAAIGEEIIFRLFFISFWVWLISEVMLKGRARLQVFWVVVMFSAIVFTFGHFPSVMMLYGGSMMSALPAAVIIELFLLNGSLSVAAAFYLREVGFLGAVMVHLGADLMWHVVWGLLS